MCKKILLLGYLLLPTFFAAPIHAQKHCDLAISILTPADGAIIPFGDTADLDFSITNLGLDTLDETDTFYFKVLNVSLGTLPFSLHLPPGNTFSGNLFTTWHDGSDNEDAELSTCLILRPELSASVIDTIQTNDTSCVTFVLKGPPVGIDRLSKGGPATLKMYPNPATSAVFIAVPENDATLPRIAVYDLAGRLIREKVNTTRSSDQEIRVDVSSLHRGIYLLKMYKRDQVAYGKLVVQ